MKKSALIIFLTPVFVHIHILAQSPHKIDYQAVVRNTQGLIMNSRTVIFRFSIHQSEPEGSIVYQELQETTTNSFGLVTLEIGAGIPQSGSFPGINWLSGEKFIQVEVRLDAADPYTDMGTSQLISVPYALYAEKAGTLGISTDHDTSSTNELQTLIIHGKYLSISKGNTIAIPLDSNDFDKDPLNEIQVITISHDTIMLSRNGGRIKLPPSSMSGSGQNGYVTFWTSASTLSGDNKLYWDNTNKRLGLGLSNPARQLDISQSIQLPNTSDANTGIIFKSGVSFLHDYGNDNVFVGRYAGNFTLTTATARYNIGLGRYALNKLNSAAGNIAIGVNALYSCTSGGSNIALGYNALYSDTSGTFNNAIGYLSMEKNTCGIWNSAIGYIALRNNTTGNYNVALGPRALECNTTGNYNTACGCLALSSNRTGILNVAIGEAALLKNQNRK